MTQTSSASSLRSSMQVTNEWLGRLADELHLDHDDAFQVLRLGLGVLRDNLTVEAAANLAAQLPIVVRGIYYHEWDPSNVPVDVDEEDVVERLWQEPVFQSSAAEPKPALQAVAGLLADHLAEGQVAKVADQLPGWLAETVPVTA